MRLRYLTLHGFKTFVPKTDLVLGEGITAIVGPNGSGKSNVADAIRWALGEQSLSMLRAKRTEDLIFAGSSNRQPVGMAEVSLTIDNSDRLLPLDFAEVTLTRRAYRSGENEYYINKSRVRLREVLEVASTLGQAYTVVGQGLVDAALSARPEERRELFEEAAAIRGYFVQREDALRRLTRTEENMSRVADLVAELEPQVRRMERQARQAQEYGKIEADLREAMQEWYAGRWQVACMELERAQGNEEAARRAVESRKAEVAAKSAQLAEARKAVWELVDTVSALHEQRAQIQARHATESQTQAVLAERLSASRAQMRQLAQEQEALASAIRQAHEHLVSAEQDVEAREAGIAALREAGKEVAARLSGWDGRIEELRGRYDRESRTLESAARQSNDLRSRILQAQRQISEQENVAQDAESKLTSLTQKLSAEEAALDERHAQFVAAQRTVSAAEAEQTTAQSALSKARAAQSTAEATRRELQRRLDGLNSQIAALAGEQQASLYGGVRAVVSAAREGRLVGYVGTVAELLHVPTHLETAIEAALGGRLQDVVVSTWTDAERGIAMLKQLGAGRATFLPLDTLRATPASNPPSGPGIVGLARDLVEYEPHLKTLAESLLGRLVIVDDLPSARRTIAALPANAPWTLATLGGEVVRPGGSVTGGSNSRADDNRAKGHTILARERKQRELNASQQELKRELAGAEREVNSSIESVREQEAALSRLAAQSEDARKKQVASQMAYVEQQSAVARLQQEISWRNGLLGETRRNIEGARALAERTDTELAELEAGLEPQRAAVAQAEADLKQAAGERESVAGLAGSEQTRLAVMEEALRNARTRHADLRRELQRFEGRMSDLATRLEMAGRDETATSRQIDEHSARVVQLAEQLVAIEARVDPSEHEVRVLEAEVGRVESEQSALQSLMLDNETALSHAAVERQRCIGTLDSLQVEISEELGDAHSGHEEVTHLVAAGVETGAGATLGGLQVVWPSALRRPEPHATGGSSNGHTTDAAGDMQALERRVYALKARLSRIGPVNPLAMEEFTSLSERHAYLQTQLGDLSTAADSLRRVIAELDRAMRDQFAATFEQVNEKFQHFFNLLFAGGTARLELTNPQDAGQSGIEISAQPPGKRMQPLAALSGGERALTSAALLFALLKVRPVPFCVLDEVDAALDESNVTRFRSALQELGEKTQFVVITHNRGTIEAANTMYGVSMAGDGTSQLLSLKVED
ncbi:MAG: chromosome segregation protein [Chloroflexia bacterium]|nr:chromosome segregation protein [Chloroflexia bacterium]